MFLDGITYAAISRNLAEGRGRFWEPFYTATIYPAFHEHPPLVFFLQSLWFRVFGDRWFVERLYCAAIGVVTAVLIAATWRTLGTGAAPPATLKGSPYDQTDSRSVALSGPRMADEWLPILLWIAVPVVSWAIVGNMLEATVAFFVVAAVAALPTWTRTSIVAAIGGGALSGLCIAGAFLSKGPVGLFPLAAPLLLGVIPDRRPRMIWAGAAQWTIVAACALALFAVPSAHASLQTYLDEQVLASLSGRREITASSTTIVATLMQSVWPPMIVLGVVAVVLARGFQRPSARDRAIAIAFIAIGLSGTVPLMVSPKQMGHYVMPAVSFFAIGAAALLARTVDVAQTRLSAGRGPLVIGTLAAVIALGSVAAIRVPALEREPRRLAQLDRLEPLVPRRTIAAICPSVNGDWSLHAWFQRRFGMSLDAGGGPHEWFLKTSADAHRCTPESCRPASDPSEELVLMRCR
jgi:4-amino-4-deoxy-L-arabinose transferase-like glycosyltransferase